MTTPLSYLASISSLRRASRFLAGLLLSTLVALILPRAALAGGKDNDKSSDKDGQHGYDKQDKEDPNDRHFVIFHVYNGVGFGHDNHNGYGWGHENCDDDDGPPPPPVYVLITYTLQPIPDLYLQLGTGTAQLKVSVSTASSTPITYQWYRSGVPIAGATSTSLTIRSDGSFQSGAYYVIATNPAGSVKSAETQVVISPIGSE